MTEFNMTFRNIKFSIGSSAKIPTGRTVIESPGTRDFVGDNPGARFIVFKAGYVIPYDPRTILHELQGHRMSFSEISGHAKRVFQDIAQDSSIEALYDLDDPLAEILVVFQLMTDLYDQTR